VVAGAGRRQMVVRRQAVVAECHLMQAERQKAGAERHLQAEHQKGHLLVPDHLKEHQLERVHRLAHQPVLVHQRVLAHHLALRQVLRLEQIRMELQLELRQQLHLRQLKLLP